MCGDQIVKGRLTYHTVVAMRHGNSTAVSIRIMQTGLRRSCPLCQTASPSTEYYNYALTLLFIELAVGHSTLYTINRTVKVMFGNNQTAALMLHGIVHWKNQNHFVSRIVTKDQNAWFNDGIDTGRLSSYELPLSGLVQSNQLYVAGLLLA
jgi:hypothetical protein